MQQRPHVMDNLVCKNTGCIRASVAPHAEILVPAQRQTDFVESSHAFALGPEPHLEGGEGANGLVYILYVGCRVLGPVQHHCGVVNERLLCRILVRQRWLLQRVGG